ncbi:hypothetical protein [Crenothrix polyspora]|uniref:Uncharacterized protein n=1 Tax=Crenothrix polyspora TaxID=360316 RepID=A0A1R4HEN2_9GAMM|nr:hypothetical protein [Crenothrix polyspora]SJM94667.1 hypothetical protein CRENPOLYSF1_570021 [Crenothrix polyspora]
MAATNQKIKQVLEVAPEPTAALPAVIPLTSSSVTLGTLQAATPGALVAGASELAGELAAVIDKQHLSTLIKGRKHVNVEGWTTLGVMLGCIAREVSTTETDGIYTATVELVRMSDGACISRASAECGSPDELDKYGKPIWSARPRYARRSMAQTRATGKACRLAFSWIMSLAGYEVTPAKEMTPIVEAERELPPSTKITASQHKLLEAQIRDYRLDRERVKTWIAKAWHVEHFTDLTPVQFEKLLIKLESWAGEEYAKGEADSALSADVYPFSGVVYEH